MKKADIKKIEDMHTNRLLVATAVSFVLIVALIIIYKVWTGGGYIEARNIKLAVSIAALVSMVVNLVVMFWKKKWHLVEFAGLSAVMAVLFYGMYGSRIFVNLGLTSQIMETVTYWAVGFYLAGTIIFHSVAPKIIAKKK
ncbi:MAG: hypothetical protein IKB50_02950 [Clostridia bacterium]|nr:hypothetical protein [Clostridia bacterium]